MEDFYSLNEQEIAEYESWLDRVNEQYREDEEFTLPEDTEFSEEDLFESYDESYSDEDEQVIGYDDLLDTEEEYRELDFND